MKKLIVTLFLVLPLSLQADLKAGDPAPAFSMQGSDGGTYSLDSLKGKPFVIAFFPKVFTGG
ncbi:MAG: redoxin domain-containing protein [Pseudomonadales bacterium]|nr:redoxin domain-containing protein [Pseudomonadales bacterium]MBO6566430.1 redoxin domain-containing protein [Pseudomonadales bacterium]MBO6595418.1 redoxin domain-containing protein [Pseudomonadales bacterium]MBO6658939.1 redoxin domain-containing protein [Pseudomonadales bacterium]MBO6701918.1 redoxin domain-containing protein [Pseudomonadales bacterium]